MASAKATTNHDEIRKWVEARGGYPAHVKTTANRRGPGVLRIDYPGFSGQDTLERIDWDTWFQAFDKNKLAFLYQGGRSRFSKLIDRSQATGHRSQEKRTTTKKRATTKSSSAATKRTTSHATIRRWVEARGGYPARVKATGRGKKDPGILRIDYDGYSGEETLQRIDWDTWFDAFDKNNLAFLYQDKRNSRFSKLVER